MPYGVEIQLSVRVRRLPGDRTRRCRRRVGSSQRFRSRLGRRPSAADTRPTGTGTSSVLKEAAISDLEDFLAHTLQRHALATTGVRNGDARLLIEMLSTRDPVTLFPAAAVDHLRAEMRNRPGDDVPT
jgi:hypothetical protein